MGRVVERVLGGFMAEGASCLFCDVALGCTVAHPPLYCCISSWPSIPNMLVTAADLTCAHSHFLRKLLFLLSSPTLLKALYCLI